jgi:hypothetical protein
MINLVVALAAESRPLVRHFGLSEDRSVTGFRVFRGDGMALVVTGMGRVSCAAGTAALAASGGRDPQAPAAAWLNVGIAGHGSLDVGEGVHALSVLEAATGRRWYPAQVMALPGRGEAFCTVDVPEAAYPEPYVYDMEASAFCATAIRYSTSELVQVYKIISDNHANGPDTVEKHRVRDIMTRHLATVEEIVTDLSALAKEAASGRARLDEWDRIVSRWHFSATQRHQLRDMMRQWEILSGGRPLMDADLNRCPSARAVLGEIDTRLRNAYGGRGEPER